MLVLSLPEARAQHGDEIGKLIESRSGGRLKFALQTLGERERCYYRLTREGRRVLGDQRKMHCRISNGSPTGSTLEQPGEV